MRGFFFFILSYWQVWLSEINCGGWFSTSHVNDFLLDIASLVDAGVPVKVLTDGKQQVDCFTSAAEDDHFLVLVRVEEGKQIQQSVLSWDLHPKLLNLARDRIDNVNIGSILVFSTDRLSVTTSLNESH